jgi:hypothetical protein
MKNIDKYLSIHINKLNNGQNLLLKKFKRAKLSEEDLFSYFLINSIMTSLNTYFKNNKLTCY